MTETRKFEFPPRTQLQQKERTKAVAWATAKVGGWRGPNVTSSIQKYLADAGFKVDQQHIKHSMTYLVEHNLAIAVVIGRRTREFILAPDVELDEPDFLKAQRARAASHAPANVEPAIDRTNGHASTAAAVVAAERHPADMVLPGRGRQMPRLPSSTRSEPDRLDDMLAALRTWYRTDPDACELWIDAVLRDLGVTP